MKIGIITDVHNNVIALNAVLQLFEEKKCDKIYINCGSLGCTSTNEGIAQGGILTICNRKPIFEKIFAEYDLQMVLEEIDSIKYPAYEDIKKFFYGVK